MKTPVNILLVRSCASMALAFGLFFSCQLQKEVAPADQQSLLGYKSGEWVADSIVTKLEFTDRSQPASTSRKINDRRYVFHSNNEQYTVFSPASSTYVLDNGAYEATGIKIKFKNPSVYEMDVISSSATSQHWRRTDSYSYNQKTTADYYLTKKP